MQAPRRAHRPAPHGLYHGFVHQALEVGLVRLGLRVVAGRQLGLGGVGNVRPVLLHDLHSECEHLGLGVHLVLLGHGGRLALLLVAVRVVGLLAVCLGESRAHLLAPLGAHGLRGGRGALAAVSEAVCAAATVAGAHRADVLLAVAELELPVAEVGGAESPLHVTVAVVAVVPRRVGLALPAPSPLLAVSLRGQLGVLLEALSVRVSASLAVLGAVLGGVLGHLAGAGRDEGDVLACVGAVGRHLALPPVP